MMTVDKKPNAGEMTDQRLREIEKMPRKEWSTDAVRDEVLRELVCMMAYYKHTRYLKCT